MFNREINPVFFIPILLLISQGCSIYSFSGASIAPDVKSVTINYIPNQSAIFVPTLSQDMTEQLKDKFTSESNLTLKDSNGDLEINGVITGYQVSGIAPTGNETTKETRITISVNIDFINRKDTKQKWKKSFTRYDSYDNTRSPSEAEEEIIVYLLEKLADDIFKEAVVNW